LIRKTLSACHRQFGFPGTGNAADECPVVLSEEIEQAFLLFGHAEQRLLLLWNSVEERQ